MQPALLAALAQSRQPCRSRGVLSLLRSSSSVCHEAAQQDSSRQSGSALMEGAASSPHYLQAQQLRDRLLSSSHASSSSMSMPAQHPWRQQSTRGLASEAATATPESQSPQPPGWLPFVPNPAVKPRKPEDIVGERHWMLRGYSRNLPPRQLVGRLLRRKSTETFWETLRLYQPKIDGITVAAAVARLMRMQRYPEDFPHSNSSARAAIMSWLLPFAVFQLRYCTARTLVALLWAWASLAPNSPERKAWPSNFAAVMVERCARAPLPGQHHRLSRLSPDRLSLLAWSASRLLGRPEPLEEPASHATKHTSSNSISISSDDNSSSSGSGAEGSAPTVSAEKLAAELSRGQHDVATLASTLSYWGTKQLHHYSVERLGILAYGLARLHAGASRDAVQRIAEEAAHRTQAVGFPGFMRADCVRFARACTLADVREPLLFSPLAVSALASLHRWPAQDAGVLAEAFGATRIKHKALLDAAAHAVLRSSASSSTPRPAEELQQLQQQQQQQKKRGVWSAGGSAHALGLPGLGTDMLTSPQAVAGAARQVLDACQQLDHPLPLSTAEALSNLAVAQVPPS